MPQKLPDKAPAHGLTTHNALKKLISGMEQLVQAHSLSWKTVLVKAISLKSVTSLFPWTCALAGTIQAVVLLVASSLTPTSEGSWFALEGSLLLLFTILNVLLNIFEHKLLEGEMKARVTHVINRLRQVKDHIYWSQSNYPHLHTPLSDSIVLQWTIRDKKQVNLPWALLVEQDLILLQPGQAAPGKCHCFEKPEIKMSQGEVLHVETHSNEEISPTPEFKSPALPQLFVMEETPYLEVVRNVLNYRHDRKPPLILYRTTHLFFVRILVHILFPIFLLVVLVWNVLRHGQDWSYFGGQDATELLFVEPLAVTLPLLSLSFPFSFIIVNYIALAWVLGVYGSSRHMNITNDPFDDTLEEPSIKPNQRVPFSMLKKYFISALLGKGEYLCRSENLVHALGSITALCCTDKKGVLSWPNATPEKIFVVKKDSSKEQNRCNPEGKNPNQKANLIPEILNVTHDHRNPFQVEFDDPGWRKYMNYLKPLGLGILLNTCNISTEEKYTNFFNHLVCESMKVGDTDSSKQHGIDMLPIVTRGCICELAKKIGFGNKTTTQYILANQVQTFKHVQPNIKDKFARNLSLARLKFPFPHLVSVIVQHRATGSRQLFSQGTGDIVLDSCTDCWCGNDLETLTEDIRKKILDFYQRASLSSYCTAFAIRPQTFPLPWKNFREYLQLPTHSNPFYWQYNELPECVDADEVTSHIPGPVAKDEHDPKRSDHYIKTKEDAMTCLELECNQTFLGLIQLQYQAVVEVVQLIDLLEKACIRFVHFSKENELRSRVFSEKMGLESGWNCHISLKSNKNNKKTVSFPTGENGDMKSEEKLLPLHKKIWSSLPDKLNRPAWFLDFPKWQEIKGAWNGDRIKSSSPLLNQEESVIQGSKSNLDEDVMATPRHASVTSDSDPFEYDMSNRAQLPRGIENIRPHLESMDNVPLLVSLFTDCTPNTTVEMLSIMQDYGEVVCVMGSSANYRNVEVFLQSDASMAIEPRYPQLCQRVPVSTPPKSGPSPVAVSQLLNSVASSLSFKMDDKISIFHLIMESRHFMLAFINCLKFWFCCLGTLSYLQIISIFLTFPLFMTTGQTLWMTLLIIPFLSLSLLGLHCDPNVMNISTGKNKLMVNFDNFKYALWCYGTRFMPSIAILAVCHLMVVIDIGSHCTHTMLDEERQANNLTLDQPCATVRNDEHFPEVLEMAQYLNFVFTFLYLTCISMSFISRGHQIWQRHPGCNKAWLVIVSLLCCTILILTLFKILTENKYSQHVDLISVWILWVVGLPVVIVINEIVKRQEIKVDVRHQKRERLEFGTKLGMNSPF